MREPPTTGRLSPTMTAISVFAAFCLLSSARMVFDTPAPRRVKADDIGRRSDQRFAALKTELPQRGVVGYVGETGNLAVGDYYLTQYALAPLVVEHSSNHAIVVGNFPSGVASGLPANLQLTRDFGDGVLLFSNKDAR